MNISTQASSRNNATAAVVALHCSLGSGRQWTKLGAELNAELERGRQIEAGHPADREPFVEPRKAPKSTRS